MSAFVCKTEGDTEALGARLAGRMRPPCLVTLYGDLGAGKTAFVRGVAQALGAKNVTSPTFNIVHEYDTVPKVYHFDAYRLSDGEALLDIGFDEYLRKDAIILLEWAELVEDALPRERISVTVLGSGELAREIAIEPVGTRCERMVEGL